MKRIKIRKKLLTKSRKPKVTKPIKVQSDNERLGVESKSGILGMLARGGIRR